MFIFFYSLSYVLSFARFILLFLKSGSQKTKTFAFFVS
ncbi:hypothetical protein HPSSW114_1548 [Glaesserella parasuis SW114]|nr:hypothetical protein HPSSW114_1548 [Glaesserella parasuis SW114]